MKKLSRVVLDDKRTAPDEAADLVALALIRQVWTFAKDNTESFADDNLGVDLAYLLGAIAKGHCCEWEWNRPLLALLRQGFARKHPVWKHIRALKDDSGADSQESKNAR